MSIVSNCLECIRMGKGNRYVSPDFLGLLLVVNEYPAGYREASLQFKWHGDMADSDKFVENLSETLRVNTVLLSYCM